MPAGASVCGHCGRAVPQGGAVLNETGRTYAVGQTQDAKFVVWHQPSGVPTATFGVGDEGWHQAWERYQQLEGTATAVRGERNTTGIILGLVGAGLMVIGSILPWATVASGFGQISVSGTEGDGKITIILGILAGVAALAELGGQSKAQLGPAQAKPAQLGRVGVILGVIAAGVGLYGLSNVSSRLAGVESTLIHASVGTGLFVVIGGAALSIIGGAMKR